MRHGAERPLPALREAGLEPVLAAARQKVYEEDGVRGRVRLVLGAARLEELANLLGRVSVRGGQVLVPCRSWTRLSRGAGSGPAFWRCWRRDTAPL